MWKYDIDEIDWNIFIYVSSLKKKYKGGAQAMVWSKKKIDLLILCLFVNKIIVPM